MQLLHLLKEVLSQLSVLPTEATAPFFRAVVGVHRVQVRGQDVPVVEIAQPTENAGVPGGERRPPASIEVVLEVGEVTEPTDEHSELVQSLRIRIP